MQSETHLLAVKLAKEILEYDRLEKDAKEQKEKLKNDLTTLCNSVYPENFIENKWELKEIEASINLALNPMKVIDNRTGVALKPEQRQAIAVHLADKYCTVDINVKEAQLSVESDKSLKAVLNSHHASIIQETRWDVKRIKK